jgi:probable rRNA maturation factor
MEESDQSSSLDIEGLPPELSSLRGTLRQAALQVLLEHDVKSYAISIAFTGNGEISELNEERLGRTGPTDVIAFDLSEEGLPIDHVGDIYISVDTALENAGKYGVTLGEELLRLVIHGVLHVLGYADTDERDRARMEQVQESMVKRFSSKLEL